MIKNERLYYMDAMRSILMILGIVLHSANVFSDKEWAIQNLETSILFLNLSEFIHIFRMPAFFIVSGFFCHMTLKKSKPKQFSIIRIPRILIPLTVTALTLNIIQNVILVNYAGESISFTNIHYWVHGIWDSHLWFLNTLLYYFACSALLYALIPNILSTVKELTNTLLNYTRGSYLLLIPVISLVLLKISYFIPTVEGSNYDFSISESIKYSGFFIFGILLGTNKNLLRNFVQPRKLTFVLCLILIISIYISNYIFDKSIDVVQAYANQLIGWIACSACFYIFFKFFNNNSRIFKYLASASYSIYLFHHILVIVFGLLIIQLNINVWIKFTLLTMSVFIATNLIHRFLISRNVILSYLFNGRHPNA